LVLAPLVLLLNPPWLLMPLSLPGWTALLGISLLSTAFAYVLYFRILATAGPTNLVLVTFLTPVTALLASYALLGEAVAPRAFLGMALIAMGLAAIDGRAFRR
jgi:drug/metabolite transporter (DMT)-like permease